MVKIAINGFGRIGKEFLIQSINRKNNWNFVINTLGDIDEIIYSIKYDSVHNTLKEKITKNKDTIKIGKKLIKVYQIPDPENLPWKKEKINVVIEATGIFRKNKDAIKHIKSGAKKVIITAPSDECTTIIPGINNSKIKNNNIISAGSCTTNCVTPMAKILNDHLKIVNSYFITTHAYTSTQKLVDDHNKKDPRRGRAAAMNIIPTTTGAAISVCQALPELKGKLDGYALRVPVINGSMVSLIAEVKKKTSSKELNKLFKQASKKEMKKILEYTEDSIVSTDIIGNPHSCIFDSKLTTVHNNFVSIAGWYDNEVGYVNRLIDLTELLTRK